MTDRLDIDAPFKHYSLSHRLVAWVSTRMFGGVEYTVRRGLLAGMRRHGGLGFVPAWIGTPISDEDRFWESLALDGRTIFDIGAFEGLIALYFAKRAARVVSWEPMPRNRARFLRNIELNGVTNITVRPVGLSDAPGEIQLSAMELMPGGTSGDPEVSAGIEASRGVVRERVPVTTLDEDAERAGFPVPDMLKIDVEGMEAAVLRGARRLIARVRPTIYLELHGDTIRQKRRKTAELIALLRDELGYRDVRHVETGRVVTPADAGTLFEGHLFAEGSVIPWPGRAGR